MNATMMANMTSTMMNNPMSTMENDATTMENDQTTTMKSGIMGRGFFANFYLKDFENIYSKT